MHALTVTGAVLLAVFFVFFLALLAELSYVLCRRQSLAVAGSVPHAPSVKELLSYFLCCKNQSRVEPAGNAPRTECQFPEEMAEEAEEDVVAKWQMGLLCGSYGPSRTLFTIKEEEREDGFSAEEISGDGEDLRVPMPEENDDSTPFSTPCASPPYYTPTPSPGREGISGTWERDDVIGRV